jgi:hypothetical protein
MTPLLDWDDVTDSAGYHVQVNTSNNFSGILVEDNDSTATSQYQVAATLTNNTTYYWHVRVKNADGVWGNWSSTWNFTVDVSALNPGWPPDGSLIYDTTPLLTWGGATGSSKYHVQVSTSDSFNTGMIEENDDLSASHFQLSTTLQDNTTYYWRVRMQDEEGMWSDWSDIWNFSVDILPPNVNIAPILNADETYTRDSNVTVSHSVSEATQMILSEDSSFSGSSWVAFQENPLFTLSAGDGTKTVYIKYRDDVGNETGTYSDTIIYDHNVYVSSSGSDLNAGTPDSPLLTLSTAVALAQTSTPTEVRVEGSAGEVLYDLGTAGFSIPAGVSLMGGYNSDFTSRDSATYVSKISSTNTHTVLFDGSSINNDTVLDGFTITNTASFVENAYTVYCINSASPTISHNIIANEAANVISSIEHSAATACIFSESSSPVIEYNEIIGGGGTHNVNPCAGSAGIFCSWYGNPVIQNNISIDGGNGTANNSSSAGSVAIYCAHSNATIINNQSIYGGSGDVTTSGKRNAGSAGIYCLVSNATISGNKLIDGGNGSVSGSAESSAGSVGIYYHNSGPDIINNEMIFGGSGISYSQNSVGSAGIAGRGSGLIKNPIISGNLQISGGSGQANGTNYCSGSAGTYCEEGAPIIRDNLSIYGGNGTSTGYNSAGSAGIYCNDADATIHDNHLIDGGIGSASGNYSAGSAGIFSFNQSETQIYNNMEINGGNGSATGNDSSGGSGILCINESSAIIYNNVIVGESASATNNATMDTVALWFDSVSSGKVANNVLFHQTLNEYSIGIYLGNIGDIRIANNIVFSGDGTYRYGVYEDGATCDPTNFFNNLIFDCPSGLYYDEGSTAITDISVLNALTECSGNITTTQTLSQLFVGGSPFDYHLTSGSDAIDAGYDTSNSYWGEVTDDIDGETRPNRSAYDIGFDEY